MRAAQGAGVALALVLGACRSPEAGGQLDAGALPEPHRLHCESLLPPEVHEPLLRGFTRQPEARPCASCGPLCPLHSAEQPGTRVTVALDCQARYAGEQVSTLLAPTLSAGGREVPALGRAAVRHAPAPGLLQVLAWDEDTPCLVIVTWLGPEAEQAPELARRVLLTLTPERLKE